jgi:hypothetical protein
MLLEEDMVAPSGIEPELFALRGRRVNQLHHGAVTGFPYGIGSPHYISDQRLVVSG